MWTGRFDPRGRTPWVLVRIAGPRAARREWFIVDTGSPVTIVDSRLLQRLGYHPGHAKRKANLIGAGGMLPGHTLDIEYMDAMGTVFAPVEVVSQEIPSSTGVQGLVGMDLLVGRVLTVDCIEGLISVGP